MPVTTHDFDKQLRETLRTLLSQCTKAQQEFFHKIYPYGIDHIKYTQLNTAIMQCQRTIQKNKEKASAKDELVEVVNQTTTPKIADEISLGKPQPCVLSTLNSFKCCECGETNPELQYMTTDYCFVCINK